MKIIIIIIVFIYGNEAEIYSWESLLILNINELIIAIESSKYKIVYRIIFKFN